jgi:membrane-associated phospholipid phosphatase
MAIAGLLTKLGSFKLIVLMNIGLLIYFYQKSNRGENRIFRSRFDTMFYATLMQIPTALLIKIIKHICGRARPYYVLENGLGHSFSFFKLREEFLSFPSGHSAGIWAFAVSLLFVFKDKKELRPIILGIATTISFTRLLLNFHFLSDILFGGIIASYLMFRFMLKIDKSDKRLR